MSEEKMDLENVRNKFLIMKTSLNAAFMERSEAIEIAQLSMISGTNPLFLGPPGTAKSAVFNAIMAHVGGARKMGKLITQFTTEDELIGPPRLSALKNDIFDRNLDGGLAGVECAFLDEIFKGSSSILNTTLSCLNEHTYNGKSVPLRMAVAASNELPTDEILGAINDRFLLRAMVGDIESDANFSSLLASASSVAKRSYVPASGSSISLAEWDAARDAAATVGLPNAVIAECARVRKALKSKGLYVSPRRWTMMVRVLQASAWLDGSTDVELDHLSVLKAGLWTNMDDRNTVASVIDTIDAGVLKQIVDLADDALRLAEGLANMDAANRRDKLPEVGGKLTGAGEKIKALVQAGVGKRAKSKAKEKLTELRSAYTLIEKELASRMSLSMDL